MDPVSTTLKILPELGSAVDAYRCARSKFKTFRHYSKEIKRIYRMFDIQRECFINEMKLLLSLVLQDQAIVADMMKNLRHDQWSAESLENDLKILIGRNMPSLNYSINDINTTITALQEKLQCFQISEEQMEQVEVPESKSWKTAIRSLENRIQITRKKSYFEDQIARLDRSNSEFGRLRQQLKELRASSCRETKRSSDRKRRLPSKFKGYGAIRSVLKSFYEALVASWIDTEASHLQHLVKLFWDVEMESDIQMAIAILCYGDLAPQRAIVQPYLTRVQVRSRTIRSIARSTEAPVPDMDESQNGPRKRVRFASVSDSSESDSSESASEVSPLSFVTTVTTPSSAASLDDFELSGHFCSELSTRCSAPNVVCKKQGLGHISSCMPDAFRHCFFPCPEDSLCTNMNTDKEMLMEEVLKQPIQSLLTIVDQLQLARRLVSAVLKFNSTPWLKEVWNVGDLAFFRRGDEDIEKSLQTLHFGVELIHGAPDPKISFMEVEQPGNFAHSSIEDAQYKLGIRNLTLYSLGTALLAIGQWKRIDHNDVEGVRRLASEKCYLGEKYKNLTKKLLYCDFGCGEDLERAGLEEAIYETIILELESIIARLDISRD